MVPEHFCHSQRKLEPEGLLDVCSQIRELKSQDRGNSRIGGSADTKPGGSRMSFPLKYVFIYTVHVETLFHVVNSVCNDSA